MGVNPTCISEQYVILGVTNVPLYFSGYAHILLNDLMSK